jgi:hypothetical protein
MVPGAAIASTLATTLLTLCASFGIRPPNRNKDKRYRRSPSVRLSRVSDILPGVYRAEVLDWYGATMHRKPTTPIEDARDIGALRERHFLHHRVATFVTLNLAHSTQKTRDFL